MTDYRKILLPLLFSINMLILTSCGGSESYINQDDITPQNDINISRLINNRYIIGSVETPSYASDVAVSADEGTAFVAAWESGLQIVNISNQNAPTIIGSIDTPDRAHSIALSSDENRVFIADMEGGMQIIDVSNPTAPSIIGSLETTKAYNIVLSADESKAYIADDSSGLQIVDISDPTSPSIISFIKTSGITKDVILSADGSKAFLANESMPSIYDNTIGLKIIDISDPTAPFTIITGIDFYNDTSKIALSADNSKVFLGSNSGLEILDISDPSTPIHLAFLATPAYDIFDITLSSNENRAFITYGNHREESNLAIVDIHDPANPSIISSIHSIASSRSLVLSLDETKAFIADGDAGLTIIDLTVPVPQKFGVEISTSIEEKALVGKLDMSINDYPSVSNITLIGEGSENFTINSDGKIYVAVGAELNYLTNSFYTLIAVGNNSAEIFDIAIMYISVTPIKMDSAISLTLSSDKSKAFITGGYLGFKVIDLHVNSIDE